MRRPVVLFPLLGLLVLAIAAVVLVKTGKLDLPFGNASEVAETSDGGDSGDGSAPARKDGKKKGKKGEDEEEVVPVPVELARVDARPISAYYRASSVVEADRLVQLVARTAGRVKKVAVEEGDWVSANQVLAELENDRERIGLRQAELKVADQKRELDRATNLLERQLVTQDQFDDTNSAYELAVTERDLAAIKLEETLVRAPFAGQITERIIVPGQFLQLASPTFGIVDVEPLRVRIHLPDVIARKVRVGDKVNLDVEAAPKPVPAVVERIAPVVDPTTSTVRLTLLVQGEPENLRVGGFVKVRVTTDTQMEALAVPKVALVEEGGLRSVFVADADSVRKVEVRTGLYDDSHIEILDGVEKGDWIVSLGQGGLRMGSKIEVLNAADVGWVAPEKPATDETPDGEDADTTATDPDETVTLAADGR
ncbi:MAG: efflux RND transporter periplasmic adaptor subunit [bacterium]